MAKKKNVQIRRKNGEGTIYQMKNGRYGAAVSLGYDDEGNRIRPIVTGKTEEDVRQKMQALLIKNSLMDNQTPIITINGSTKIEDVVDEYIKNAILDKIIPSSIEWSKVGKNQISSRTAENYTYALKPFKTHFTGYTLDALTTEDLWGFFKKITYYSNVTLNRIHFIVNKMLNRCVRKKWLLENPMDNEDFSMPVSKQKDKEVQPLSDEEIKKLTEAVADNMALKTIVHTALYTGCRMQEILCLRWRNIDFINETLRIENALTTETTFNGDGKIVASRTVSGRTKRKPSIRTLSVDDYVLGLLKDWKAYAKEHTKTEFGNDDFIFGNSRSDHYTVSGFQSTLDKYLNRILGKGHGLSRVHRFRHTVATKVGAQGASTIELMQLLGDNQERSVLRYVGQSQTIAKNNRERLNAGMADLVNK